MLKQAEIMYEITMVIPIEITLFHTNYSCLKLLFSFRYKIKLLWYKIRRKFPAMLHKHSLVFLSTV